MAVQNNDFLTITGDTLKRIRLKKKWTQGDLAALADTSVRTVSKYESYQGALRSSVTLRRIIKALGIPEHEFSSGQSYAYTHEEAMEDLDHISMDMSEANFSEAQERTNVLIPLLNKSLKDESFLKRETLQRDLGLAYFINGHIKTIVNPTEQLFEAWDNFVLAEGFFSKDPTLLCLIGAHKADTLLRTKKISEASNILEHICGFPSIHKAARGNAFQFLGRMSLQKDDMRGFEYAMNQSRKIAEEIRMVPQIISGKHFSISYSFYTVLDEYARGYARLNDFKHSDQYRAEAEKIVPVGALRWIMGFQATSAEIAIRKALAYQQKHPGDGTQNDDFRYGVEIIAKLEPLARAHGHTRILKILDKLDYELLVRQNDMAQMHTVVSKILHPNDSWE